MATIKIPPMLVLSACEIYKTQLPVKTINQDIKTIQRMAYYAVATGFEFCIDSNEFQLLDEFLPGLTTYNSRGNDES